MALLSHSDYWQPLGLRPEYRGFHCVRRLQPDAVYAWDAAVGHEHERAAAAARIFDVLATVVLIFGGLLVLAQLAGAVAFLAGWAGSDSLNSDMAALGLLVPIGAFVGAIATAIVTAVNWAVITLATAIAGYVAQRSPQL